MRDWYLRFRASHLWGLDLWLYRRNVGIWDLNRNGLTNLFAVARYQLYLLRGGRSGGSECSVNGWAGRL